MRATLIASLALVRLTEACAACHGPTMLAQTSSRVTIAANNQSTEVATDKNKRHWDPYNALTIDEYEDEVINDPENMWVVAFVSPLCGACHGLADHWGQIVADEDVQDRPIKFGYVDVS